MKIWQGVGALIVAAYIIYQSVYIDNLQNQIIQKEMQVANLERQAGQLRQLSKLCGER